MRFYKFYRANSVISRTIFPPSYFGRDGEFRGQEVPVGSLSKKYTNPSNWFFFWGGGKVLTSKLPLNPHTQHTLSTLISSLLTLVRGRWCKTSVLIKFYLKVGETLS